MVRYDILFDISYQHNTESHCTGVHYSTILHYTYHNTMLHRTILYLTSFHCITLKHFFILPHFNALYYTAPALFDATLQCIEL
jgi:hypothetical protein